MNGSGGSSGRWTRIHDLEIMRRVFYRRATAVVPLLFVTVVVDICDCSVLVFFVFFCLSRSQAEAQNKESLLRLYSIR